MPVAFCEMLAGDVPLGAMWAWVFCQLYFTKGWLAESSHLQRRRTKIVRQHLAKPFRRSDCLINGVRLHLAEAEMWGFSCERQIIFRKYQFVDCTLGGL